MENGSGVDNPPSNSGLQRQVDRRTFLKKAGKTAAVVGAATAIGGPTASDVLRGIINKDQIAREISESLGYLYDTYGFTFQLKPQTDIAYSGEELTQVEKRDALEWIKKEAGKYPPEYIKEFLKPKTIVLLNALGPAGITVPEQGFDLATGKDVNFITIFLQKKSDTLDVGNLFGWVSESNFASTFHHELFHLADFHASVDDVKWAQLNPQQFGAYIGLKNYAPGPRPQGFARDYGKADSREDRATVAELLLTNPKTAMELAAQDAILSAKIATCKEYYLKLSGGKMNEQYWQDLSENRVDATYWQR